MAAARFAAIALVILSAAALAQTPPPTSVVEVHVMDHSGAVIPGATVRATSVLTGAVVSVKADATGKAALTLPAGNYTASISAPGFKVFEGQFTAPDEPGRWFDVKLNIGEVAFGGPIVEPDLQSPPVERPVFAGFIPLVEPQALLALRARRIHRRHWL